MNQPVESNGGKRLQLDLTQVNLGTVFQLAQTLIMVVGGMWALFTFVDQVRDLKEAAKPLAETVGEINTRTQIIDAEQKSLSKRVDRIELKIDNQDSAAAARGR